MITNKLKDESLLLKMSSLRKTHPSDDYQWLKRGAVWEKKNLKKKRKPGTPHDQANPPLVLAGHGVNLKIHRGSLVVQNGFTHYPQKREEYRFFAGSRSLPSRIVLLEADGVLSLDVIGWLSKQKVPLVLLNWLGEVVSIMGRDGLPDSALADLQRQAKTNGTGLKLATWLVQEKIKESINTLLTFLVSPARESATWKLRQGLKTLEQSPGSMEDLRLIEGRAAFAYFSAWRVVNLNWTGIGRHPIPKEWNHVVARQSSPGGSNRNAKHPVNAILNYFYGVLESQVRMSAITAGLDPMLGYLHTPMHNRVALVYDLMEPLRPQADQLALEFLRKCSFSPRDFLLLENGVCRLHPQLAKTVSRITVEEHVVDSVVAQVIERLEV